MRTDNSHYRLASNLQPRLSFPHLCHVYSVPPNSQIAFWVLQMLLCQPSNINSDGLLPNWLCPLPLLDLVQCHHPYHSASGFQTPSPNFKQEVLKESPAPSHSQSLPPTCYVLLRCTSLSAHTSTTRNSASALNCNMMLWSTAYLCTTPKALGSCNSRASLRNWHNYLAHSSRIRQKKMLVMDWQIGRQS